MLAKLLWCFLLIQSRWFHGSCSSPEIPLWSAPDEMHFLETGKPRADHGEVRDIECTFCSFTTPTTLTLRVDSEKKLSSVFSEILVKIWGSLHLKNEKKSLMSLVDAVQETYRWLTVLSLSHRVGFFSFLFFFLPRSSSNPKSSRNTQTLRKHLNKHIRNITGLHGCLSDHRTQTNSKIKYLIYGSPSVHKYLQSNFTGTDAFASGSPISEVKSGNSSHIPIYLFWN